MPAAGDHATRTDRQDPTEAVLRLERHWRHRERIVANGGVNDLTGDGMMTQKHARSKLGATLDRDTGLDAVGRVDEDGKTFVGSSPGEKELVVVRS